MKKLLSRKTQNAFCCVWWARKDATAACWTRFLWRLKRNHEGKKVHKSLGRVTGGAWSVRKYRSANGGRPRARYFGGGEDRGDARATDCRAVPRELAFLQRRLHGPALYGAGADHPGKCEAATRGVGISCAEFGFAGSHAGSGERRDVFDGGKRCLRARRANRTD